MADSTFGKNLDIRNARMQPLKNRELTQKYFRVNSIGKSS